MAHTVFSHAKKPFRWFKKTRKRNKVFVIFLLIIIFFIVVSQIQKATAPSPYVTEEAKIATIVQKVSETGNVNSAGSVDVYSTATGIIEEIYVNDGIDVQTGDSLFFVRSTATEQERAAAYANYETAVSNVKTAEQGKLSVDSQMWAAQQALLQAKNTKEYKDDHTKNPATGNDYTELEKEAIDTAVVQSEKNFKALETKLLESDVAIKATNAQVRATLLTYEATKDVVVKAPSSGKVANLSAKVGDKVTTQAATPMSVTGESTPPVLRLANFSDYSIKIQLNEVDIPKVTIGQEAEITLDAFSGKKFKGIVDHVDSVGTNNQGVVTYTVLVTITNPSERIRPGMTANVDIEVDRAENVLSVPNSAVKPYKGGKAVRIENKKKGGIEYIPVEVGIKGEERTQILKGVTNGQKIIISLPNDQLKRGSLF